MDRDPRDPKGLIREAYRIDGIRIEECRSIFLDWALSLPLGTDTHRTLLALLDQYRPDNADHPMTQVMTEGLGTAAPRRRRGGRSARVAAAD